MADRLGCASGGRRILLTQGMYMCDRTHKHDETERISRRRSTLVFAPGERALAAGGWLSIVTHGAVHSRELLGVPARRGPRASYALYGRKKSGRFSVYVPQELVPLVQQAVNNGRKLENLMREAGLRYTVALKGRRRAGASVRKRKTR